MQVKYYINEMPKAETTQDWKAVQSIFDSSLSYTTKDVSTTDPVSYSDRSSLSLVCQVSHMEESPWIHYASLYLKGFTFVHMLYLGKILLLLTFTFLNKKRAQIPFCPKAAHIFCFGINYNHSGENYI